MVLEGRVNVRSGHDGLRSGVSKWEMLALGAFGDESRGAGSFTPNFTATLASTTVRYLKIEASAFFALREQCAGASSEVALAADGAAPATEAAAGAAPAPATVGVGGSDENV